MAINHFRVENNRSVRLAYCNSLPPVTIITGPNGCGKSTVLQVLRDSPGVRRPMYVGPHRASRRQSVRFRFLGPDLSMQRVLEESNLPGFEGIAHVTNSRSAWDQDDASSYLKYSLCKIELERQEAIASAYDQKKEIKPNSVPDVWLPLREMAQNLLPHLSFDKIDVTNKDAIQCYWKAHGKTHLVDIDDLSSGEKSIIQLFYPLIEHKVKANIASLKGQNDPSKANEICVLMDEPELHLHPNLQGKILDYIRALAGQEKIQFIIATHSPTIVEHANSDELFLLKPAEQTPEGENQLVKIASDDERLSLLRDVFGSTSNITALRPIVVVEGVTEDNDSKRAVDSRIYGLLSQKMSRVTIIPGKSKLECQSLTNSLNDAIKQFVSGLAAHALLDRDAEESPQTSGNIHLLPVSMIENLLVDPEIIWNALTLVQHKTDLKSKEDVSTALDQILLTMEKEEVDRRIKSTIKPSTFRLKDPIQTAADQIDQFSVGLKETFSNEKLDQLALSAQNKVDEIKSKNKRREFFHGKKILAEFYKKHLHSTGMSKEIFVYECARTASTRKSVQAFFDDLLRTIDPSATA